MILKITTPLRGVIKGKLPTPLLETSDDKKIRVLALARLKPGDEVVLKPKTEKIFKLVERRFSVKRGEPFGLSDVLSYDSLRNSGLFYERKLLSVLTNRAKENLSRDKKFKALKDKNHELVQFINTLQLLLLRRKRLFLPFEEKDLRGSILVDSKEKKAVLTLKKGETSVRATLTERKLTLETNSRKLFEALKKDARELEESLGVRVEIKMSEAPGLPSGGLEVSV
ncbi:MAG: hypothetical protein GXO04_02890 [Aquificae bacterium]|nr:hypothetical protein [Aquificota bacterium]